MGDYPSRTCVPQERVSPHHLTVPPEHRLIFQLVSALAEQPFDADEFPFAFLEAFGNKTTTIKRLRSGASNKSDLGGIVQTDNIHIKTCPQGEVTAALAQLKASPATTKAKAKFILATDGHDLEAEDLTSGETIACRYTNFPDHFGFFLPLAGISTVKQIRESAFDIKATGRLNRLYVTLLNDKPTIGSTSNTYGGSGAVKTPRKSSLTTSTSCIGPTRNAGARPTISFKS